MRTFIGLSFTWLPNRVRPDQVLVPFVPTINYVNLGNKEVKYNSVVF
jgi:hypothetical protein